MQSLVKKNILGIQVSDVTEDDVLKYIFDRLEKKEDSFYIVTPNPEMIMLAQREDGFRKILNQAEISLCDGVGLYLASRILKKAIKRRITGVDILDRICKESVRKPVSIGFLGGGKGIAERAAECLKKKYPGLEIPFAGEEWEEKRIENGKSQLIDVVFVAYGAPKQEKWMVENLHTGKYKVAIGVGGAFDYLSGSVTRAPKIVRSLGFEWLYRLIRQPWRWRRQLALLAFIWLIIKQRVSLALENTPS
jgi:N-acetylglucosaminyldiphosphoundecaprenol N-acetyl-beta-D-mannosaminyltransferase